VALDDRNDHQAKLTETKGRIFYSVFTGKEKQQLRFRRFFLSAGQYAATLTPAHGAPKQSAQAPQWCMPTLKKCFALLYIASIHALRLLACIWHLMAQHR
jgi:hypothetical protein